jgi:putative SOS response-associated peptidase YedK
MLQQILKPCSSSWLTAVEVSPLVNSPKSNDPAVLRPVVVSETVANGERGLFDEVQ